MRINAPIKKINLLILGSVLFMGTQVFAKANPNVPERIKKFAGELKGELVAAMKSGGPVKAVDVCSKRAVELAKKHSDARVTLGRSSDRLRNPANKPPTWMVESLESFKKSKSKKPVTLTLKDGSSAFLKPIYIDAPCLVCHGEKVAKPVQDILSKHYPDDKARSYKLGDFRGVFWAVTKK